MLYQPEHFLVIDQRVWEVCDVLEAYSPGRLVEFVYCPSCFYRLQFSRLKFEERFSLVTTLERIQACLYNLTVSKRRPEPDIPLMEIPVAEEYPIDLMTFGYDRSDLELTFSQVPAHNVQAEFQKYGIWKKENVITVAFHQIITLGFCFKESTK